MTWIVVNDSSPPVELDDDQLAKLLGSLSEQQPQSAPRHALDVYEAIAQLQDYFTKPGEPGYTTYKTVNQYLTDIITRIINNNRDENFQFEEPYTFKELALLWTAYNVIGEILDWLSGKLRTKSDQNAPSSALGSLLSFGIDLLGIIISFRMREFTETDIYGRILEDRQKWGFLLKDRDKQVFSQLMHVFMDLGSITYLASSQFRGIQALTRLPAVLETAVNMKFISQAYTGLVTYSESKVSPGWIAWLVQELGFLQENDLLPEKIHEISPVTMGIMGDLITVLTMGSVFYRAGSD